MSLDEAKSRPLETFRGPHSAAEAAETAALVRRILANLPEMDRRLLEAAFLHEEGRLEICRRFGVSPAYLRVLLHRAKRRFSVGVLAHQRRSPQIPEKSRRKVIATA